MADDLLDQRQAATRLGLPSARTLEACVSAATGLHFSVCHPAS